MSEADFQIKNYWGGSYFASVTYFVSAAFKSRFKKKVSNYTLTSPESA